MAALDGELFSAVEPSELKVRRERSREGDKIPLAVVSCLHKKIYNIMPSLATGT